MWDGRLKSDKCATRFYWFFVDRVMSQNRLLLTPEKNINNETVLQSAQQFRRYIFRIVLRSFSVRSPFVLRSFSVRSPFILRSSSVDPPFELRSISVRAPFGNRGTNGERSKNHRRQNGDVTTTHRCWNEGTAKHPQETNDTETRPSCNFWRKPTFFKGACAPPNIRLATYTSYENGCSPRPNLTHNRVPRLVWWHTLTRHEKGE